MGKITLQLIRRRAEHNEGEISTLEELALHQEKITKIENIDKWCRQLRVLLIQNNSISKIENLSRLKHLEYVNLAMNNIETIAGLEGCESLRKLDLTLNFIGEISSVAKLRKNHFLDQLYLVGNPCTDYEGYRDYVVSLVPQIMFLDGDEVTKSERIKARQNLPQIREAVHELEAQYFVKREYEKQLPLGDSDDDDNFWSTPSPNTPEVRAQIQKKLETDEAKRHEDPKKKIAPKARKLFADDGRPYNVNEGKYPFTLQDEADRGLIILDIGVPKHMDTSLIELDVQPTYVRLLVKKKIFQLQLPEEVKPDDSFAQRSQITGHLVVTMPKFDQDGIIQFWKGNNRERTNQIETKAKTSQSAGKVQKKVKGKVIEYSASEGYLSRYQRVDEGDVPPLI